MCARVLIPLKSGQVWNGAQRRAGYPAEVLIPLKSGQVWNSDGRKFSKPTLVLIPLKSGQVWNRPEVAVSASTSLNPFEIRAGLEPDSLPIILAAAGLNPFEIRAGLEHWRCCQLGTKRKGLNPFEIRAGLELRTRRGCSSPGES